MKSPVPTIAESFLLGSWLLTWSCSGEVGHLNKNCCLRLFTVNYLISANQCEVSVEILCLVTFSGKPTAL